MPRQPKSNVDLSQVVVPLASYSCATERPREALYSALAALFDEIKKTNTTARLHIASVRANRWACPRKVKRRSAMQQSNATHNLSSASRQCGTTDHTPATWASFDNRIRALKMRTLIFANRR